MIKNYKDSRGVEYQASRKGAPKYDKKGTRTDGFTVERISDRPVDIKRTERAMKKLGL